MGGRKQFLYFMTLVGLKIKLKKCLKGATIGQQPVSTCTNKNIM